MNLVLCRRCVEVLDAQVATLNLTKADAQRIKESVVRVVGSFVSSRQPPLPSDTCHICLLQRLCTCGRGEKCHYATWASIAVAAARARFMSGEALP